MAAKYGREEDLKEILSVSYSTAEATVIHKSNINRYWIEEKGQQFIAYIETDAYPTGQSTIRSWSLGYQELMEIRNATKAMKNNFIVPYAADSRLPEEYRLDKEHQQLLKFAELMRAAANTPLSLPEELKPMPPPTPSVMPGRHSISIQSIPTPGHLDIPEAAFLCSCKDDYFCPEVIAFMRTRGGIEMTWNDIKNRSGLGWMNLALPLFGTILHRVACKVSVVADWEGIEYQELTVRLQTFRPDPVTQFFTKQEVIEFGVNPFAWIFDMISTDMLIEPAAKQQIDMVQAFMDVTVGGNHGCTASIHNYGTTKMLRDFLNRNQPEGLNEVYAQVITSMYYNQCVICYRASELALALIDVS